MNRLERLASAGIALSCVAVLCTGCLAPAFSDDARDAAQKEITQLEEERNQALFELSAPAAYAQQEKKR